MPAGQQGYTPPSHASIVRGQAQGQNLTAPTNAWGGSSRNGLLRTATSNVRGAPSNAWSRGPPTSVHQPGTNPQILNPSNVPSPSLVGQAPRVPVSQAPSNMGGMTQAFATQCPVAKLSNKKAGDFRRGDIINLPFHGPNTDTKLAPGDHHLAATCAGYVFSKRRYAIVLWANLSDVFCVPIFTSHGGGITTKKERLRKEYICLTNRGNLTFVNQGIYPPLETEYGRYHPSSYVHITAGFVMECRCDISHSGRLTARSADDLYNHWCILTEAAQKSSKNYGQGGVVGV